MIVIYITCRDKKEAEKIGRHLVESKLAACCNFFPIQSVYKWKGKIVSGREVVLIAKTKKENFKKIEKEVKKLHSYSVPCIAEIPINRINSEYLKWLKTEILK